MTWLFRSSRWFNYEKMCLTLPSKSKTTILTHFRSGWKIFGLFEAHATNETICFEALRLEHSDEVAPNKVSGL